MLSSECRYQTFDLIFHFTKYPIYLLIHLFSCTEKWRLCVERNSIAEGIEPRKCDSIIGLLLHCIFRSEHHLAGNHSNFIKQMFIFQNMVFPYYGQSLQDIIDHEDVPLFRTKQVMKQVNCLVTDENFLQVCEGLKYLHQRGVCHRGEEIYESVTQYSCRPDSVQHSPRHFQQALVRIHRANCFQ